MTQIEIKTPKTGPRRPVVPTRPRGTPADAAADAAGFLRRLGFAVLVGLLPIAAVIMRHAVGGALIFLLFWAGLSLVWTPFFDDASERLMKALGVAACALGALGSMPAR